MNPLELSGPEFLTFFVVTALAAVLIGIVLRIALRLPAGEDGTGPSLSACEVAYLSGGKKLAIQAALARLIHEKNLALDGPKGELTVRSPLSKDAPTLERMLYRKVADAAPGSPTTFGDADTEQTDVIRRRLEEHGLLVSGSQAFLVRCLPIMVMVAVLVLGIAKLSIGIERDKPVGFLIAMLAVVGVGSLAFLWPPFRSRRGDRLLAKLRQEKNDLQASVQQRPEELAGTDLSLAMGLFGVGILTHTSLSGLRESIAPPKRPDVGGGSDGGGASCGGSSCGGGGGGCGGGGGGCGGCGGG